MKIISGGQSGVDRAALDVAIALNIKHGGWCPKGRIAEDGCIAEIYLLRETSTAVYKQRTEWNVRDSDATLIILSRLPASGGTALTIDYAKHYDKPFFIWVLDDPQSLANCHKWLQQARPGILNVAGPRESQQPGIYQRSKVALSALLNNFL
ncbi:MAG: putative molybdenum carrier protein [Pseudomonadota bacterium]